MKYALYILFFGSFMSNAQVGINTHSPQETLHVVGTARIETTDQPSVITTKLFGLNDDGTLREIGVGENLVLVNNVLHARPFDHSFGQVNLTTKEVNNLDLLLDPGEANFGKTIIRIFNTQGDTELSGIRDGYDGQHIWLYGNSGQVKLIEQDTGSSAINRIDFNDKSSAKQYAMLELVYDGTRRRWIVMQNHGD